MRNGTTTIITILLLPVIIFLYTIGWSLYVLGIAKKRAPTEKKPESYGITITTIAIDEQPTQECRE